MTHPAQPLSIVMPDDKPHRLAFIVYGTPTPQGSKTRVGRNIIHDNAEKLDAWRLDVKDAALTAMAESPGWARDYPMINAHMVFTLPRPRVHYRTGKFSHLLRDGAPQLHGSKPDLDKLLRSTNDALTAAGVFTDDSRIAQVYAVKAYVTVAGMPPGALDRPGARIVLHGVGR